MLVRHRLRLLAFPMRAEVAAPPPVERGISQVPTRSFRAWCGHRPR